ncbi:MAG: hypothetical protein ABIH42_08670 [Planctomycetota bacterium]
MLRIIMAIWSVLYRLFYIIFLGVPYSDKEKQLIVAERKKLFERERQKDLEAEDELKKHFKSECDWNVVGWYVDGEPIEPENEKKAPKNTIEITDDCKVWFATTNGLITFLPFFQSTHSPIHTMEITDEGKVSWLIDGQVCYAYPNIGISHVDDFTWKRLEDLHGWTDKDIVTQQQQVEEWKKKHNA